ncbi:MAG: nucleoside recognition protein [Desulfobacterales bacterium]
MAPPKVKAHVGKKSRRAIIISLALTGAALGLGVGSGLSLDAGLLERRLIWPLLRLIFFIGAGLLVGQWIEYAGWTRGLAVVARPLFRIARLGDRCSAAFTTAFVSGAASNAMLWGYYQDRAITRRQLFLANLINQFPAYFLHLPTTVFIVVPLTGYAGVLYFVLTFAALVLRTLGVVLYGNLKGSGGTVQGGSDRAGQAEGPNGPAATSRKSSLEFWAGIRGKLPQRLLRIAVYVVPIYTAVYVVNALGFFDLTRNWLATYVTTAFVPMESLSVVILSFAAEFTSGFAAAGALQDAGVLSVSQTVLALLAGNVVAFPIRALRHQLPRYMGIFTPKLGLQLLLLGQGLRVGSLIIVGIGYYYFFH